MKFYISSAFLNSTEIVEIHCIAPGSWLELVEMAEDQPASASRGVLVVRP
ncbi:hypothetical protein [Mycobacterium tilburgii]|nr:hypothetical protein [Mycobacterium tilburgii]